MMQCLGENYSGVITLPTLTNVVNRLQQHRTHKLKTEALQRKVVLGRENRENGVGGTTDMFIRNHWKNRIPIIQTARS